MNKLKQYIVERGIKQEWLSQKTGIPNNTISRIVNGQMPTMKHGLRIAKVLGMTAEELWGETKKDPHPEG